jgi:hypothetical protein
MWTSKSLTILPIVSWPLNLDKKVYQMWVYHQRTGELWRNGKKVAVGYSGIGPGLNNPDMDGVIRVGPIPQGRWRMEGVYNSAQVGPYAIILFPGDGTNAKGRGAFRVHGDNSKGNKTASNGCMIFPRAVREQMWQFQDHIIDVVKG